MIHTSVFGVNAPIGIIPLVGAPAYAPLTPPIDGLFSASGQFAVQVPKDLMVIAAYASDITPTLSTASFARARLNAPSLLRVGFPFIFPMQSLPTGSGSLIPRTPDPTLAVLLDNPIHLKCAEPLMVEMASSNGAADSGVAVLWFSDGIAPIPSGANLDAFWLHYTIISPTSLAAPTTPGWLPTAIQLDQNLPQGAYAVIGFSHFGPSAIAARLSFPGSPFKPGTLAQGGVSPGVTAAMARTHRLFLEGDLGILGTFQNFAIPSVEVFVNTGGTDSAATHEGFLRVIRLGDCSCI